MTISDVEELVIAAVLNNPDNIRILAPEIGIDKFSQTSRKTIFEAMLSLHTQKVPIDVPSLLMEMGSRAERAGGEAYLLTMKSKFREMGVESDRGLESWARAVDTAGRWRHVQQITDKFHDKIDDIDRVMSEVEDIDLFVADYVGKIQSAMGGRNNHYSTAREGIAELRMRLDNELAGLQKEYIDCGMPSLVQHKVFPLSSLVMLSGMPSMGKTSVSIQAALGMAMKIKENNIAGCVAFHILEMPAWRLFRRMACILSGTDWGGIEDDKYKRGSYRLERFQQALDYIETLPLFINDDDRQTSARVVYSCEALHLQSGPLWLTVSDYLGLFGDTGGKGEDAEPLRISAIGRRHKSIANRTGACVVLVSALTLNPSMMATKFGGQGSLRYSRDLDYHADVHIEIYNPPQMKARGIDFVLPGDYGIKDDRFAYVCVVKNKEGAVGNFPIVWQPETTSFKDTALGVTDELFATSEFYESAGEF